jgi:hypothetical protein
MSKVSESPIKINLLIVERRLWAILWANRPQVGFLYQKAFDKKR